MENREIGAAARLAADDLQSTTRPRVFDEKHANGGHLVVDWARAKESQRFYAVNKKKRATVFSC